MGERNFAFVFLGVFLLVLAIFFSIFLVFSYRGEIDDNLKTALWSALTILVLLFGIIGISLYLNRHMH